MDPLCSRAGHRCVAISGGTLTLTGVVRALDRSGVIVDDVALRRPTLDEVFLRLTGAWAGGRVNPAGEDGPARPARSRR